MTKEPAEILCDEIETLIDRYDVKTILDAMSIVCAEKADRIRSNWGDESMAQDWGRATGQLARWTSQMSV